MLWKFRDEKFDGFKCVRSLATNSSEVLMLWKSRDEQFEGFKCVRSLATNSSKVLNALEV